MRSGAPAGGLDINRFASELKAKGYQTVTHNGRRFWVGLVAKAKVPGVVVADARGPLDDADAHHQGDR